MIAIVISSNASRRDIFDRCIKPDLLPWKCFASFPERNDWSRNLHDLLVDIPPKYEYVLLMDDDTFIIEVDDVALRQIANRIVALNISYLSLQPLRRSFIGHLFDERPKGLFRKLKKSEPYYSSVGLAIWKRSYLLNRLSYPYTAWEFEHIVTDTPHFAVCKAPIKYEQLVTKGYWAPYASKYISLEGSNLPMISRAQRLRNLREKISFALFGFASFRIKRKLRGA